MKKRIFDIILVLFAGFVLYRQGPVWLNSFRQEGGSMTSFVATDLDGESVQIPIPGEKTVYVFWATWCGPCHQQLAVFTKAVRDGDLPGDRVVALSLGESLETVRRFQAEKQYPFRILADPSGESWRIFKVQATPSIAFVDEDLKVTYFAAGFSPMAASRSKDFLKK